jgi:hypothetical protein
MQNLKRPACCGPGNEQVLWLVNAKPETDYLPHFGVLVGKRLGRFSDGTL